MLQSQGEYHYLFKVVLVGNSCVGKSSIVVRYADDEFSEVFLATIGVDFRFKSFPLGEIRSNCRSGTLQATNVSGPSLALTTAEPMPS